MSGLVVLVTLFAASAQMFNLLTPERGLLFVVFSVYFCIQLMTALAGVTGRASMLRSLAVLFTAAFVLRFVVLESLYAPDGGMLKRVMTALLQGVSLGSIRVSAQRAGDRVRRVSRAGSLHRRADPAARPRRRFEQPAPDSTVSFRIPA